MDNGVSGMYAESPVIVLAARIWLSADQDRSSQIEEPINRVSRLARF